MDECVEGAAVFSAGVGGLFVRAKWSWQNEPFGLGPDESWLVLMYQFGQGFGMLGVCCLGQAWQGRSTCQYPQEGYDGDFGIRFAQVCSPPQGGGRSGDPVPEPQADAQAELMAEAFGFYADNILTKDHFEAVLDAKLEARFAQQDAKFDKRFADIDTRFAEILIGLDGYGRGY